MKIPFSISVFVKKAFPQGTFYFKSKIKLLLKHTFETKRYHDVQQFHSFECFLSTFYFNCRVSFFFPFFVFVPRLFKGKTLTVLKQNWGNPKMKKPFLFIRRRVLFPYFAREPFSSSRFMRIGVSPDNLLKIFDLPGN